MHRRRIDWPARLTALLAMATLHKAHSSFLGHPENTPTGVTVYLCTAALFNLASVIYFANCLKGQLSYDLQRLAFCAIILNFAGWITYLAQVSPAFINTLMAALTYGMFTRLFWISDGDTDCGGWRDLVRRLTDRGQVVHHKKAQQ